MPELIWTKSPKGRKVVVGKIDYFNRIAIFEITPERFFAEADAIGIDTNIFKRKSIQWCKKIVFKMWHGKIYEILIDDFRKNAWLYPPKNNPDYKAHSGIFKQKLVLTITKVEELHKKARKAKNKEILKASLK